VGLGFALPINVVKFVVDQVLTAGHVHIGYIGVLRQPMTSALAAAAGLTQARGAIVTEVAAPGPEQGIVQVGDIILEVRREQFADTRVLARLVAMTPIGQSLPILLWRNGAQRTVSVTVTEMPNVAQPGTPAAVPKTALDAAADPGLTGSAITSAIRAIYHLGTGQSGVLVDRCHPGGTAAISGLGPCDVIVQNGTDKVTTPVQVQHDLHRLHAQKHPYTLLLVQGRQPARWVAFPVAGGQSP
jgi:serine protease Do